jgi:hypothetical protein
MEKITKNGKNLFNSININSLNWWWTPGGCLPFCHALR